MTGSLCIHRATYWCPEIKANNSDKKDICSNFLCNTEPGAEVIMTPPERSCSFPRRTPPPTTSWSSTRPMEEILVPMKSPWPGAPSQPIGILSKPPAGPRE
mmetsp:Transcript_25486/g.54152  ORF Transcript_25486/g.54152 Transcript_25486/m.54152 type:complete len:101 (+) Transcript_25486:851-1153(+)